MPRPPQQPCVLLRARLLAAVVAALALAPACSSLTPRVDPTRPTALMKEAGTSVSAVELRQRVDGFVAPLLALIELNMDQVRAEATDPGVRRRALLLKIESIPVVYRAAFQPDPLAGILDLWLLSYQIEDCLDRGEGPCAFGEQQGLARDLSRENRERFEAELFSIARDGDAVRQMQRRVREIAARYPLTGAGAIARRYTMTDELAEAIGGRSRDAFTVIDDVSMTLADLSSRLNTYVGDVGRLARWHAELLTEDLLHKPEIAGGLTAVQRLDEVSRSLEALEETLGPRGVEVLVDGILAQVRRERVAILADVERQRNLVQAFVSAERELVLAGVTLERDAVLAGVRRERVETLAEVDAMGQRYLEATTERALGIVDHLVWRLAQLLAALLVVAALLAWLVLRGRSVTFSTAARGDGDQP